MKRDGRTRRHNPEFRSWLAMRQRCQNKNTVGWANYGGRGIRVCKRWDVFANFFADMGPKPTKKHSIDRVNANGNYSPGNCRWANKLQQARNCRSNRLITFKGQSRCISEWAEQTGLSAALIRARLNLGWNPERTLTVPRGAERRDVQQITFAGKTKPVIVWARQFKLKYTTLLHRINAGWPIQRALTTPLRHTA